MSSLRVAVRLDGIVTVHMFGGLADYYTLCGLDGNDPAIGQEPADVPMNGRARIDCPSCRAIWDIARSYSRKDFRDD